MKGNKLVIAVILALIVCLVLIPTCAFADGEQQPAAAENTGDNPAAGNSATGGDNSSNAPSGEGEGPNGEQNPAQQPEQPAQPVNQDEQQPGASGESGNVNPGDNDEDKNLSESGDNGSGADAPKPGDNGDGAEAPKPGDSEGGEQPASGGKEQPEVKEPEASGEVNEGAKPEEGSDPGVESGNEEDTPASGAESSTADAALLTAPARAPANTGETLQSKINKAGETQITIKLDMDYTESITIAEGQNIILDLNGKTLTNKENEHTIWNNGTLTIIDSVGGGVVDNVSHGRAALVNAGTATLNGGSFTRSKEAGNTNTNNGGNSYYNIKNLGTLTINDGVTVVQNDGHYSSLIANGWYCSGDEGASDLGVAWSKGKKAELTINGGTFSGGKYVVKNDDYGYLTINNGVFSNEDDGVILNTNVAEIKGGSFTTDSSLIYNWKASEEANIGKLTIAGGTFNNTGAANSKLFSHNDGSLTLNGGIFTDEEFAKAMIEGGAAVTKYGKQYGINDSAYELAEIAANDGEAIDIVGLPEDGFKINDVPAGVKFINNSGKTVIINGVEVKPGESYTVPKPAASAAYAAPLYAKYFVIEGKEQQWAAGDIEFVLNSNAVIKVLIDGVEVEFTVAEDGTVTIAAEIIEALSDGEHEIKFIFADGSCKTTFTR